MKGSVCIMDDMTISDVIAVASDGAYLTLSDSVLENIRQSYELAQSLTCGEAPVYGVNTGFGRFSEVRISESDLMQLQKNLIMSHACGVGDPMPENIVRAMMVLRVNALCKGYSGISLDTVNTLVDMINKHVTPLVYTKGSLGASGDLVPLAHMALSLLGMGKSYYDGELLDGDEALRRAGIKPAVLGAKEGLALINGTQAMNAYGVYAIYNARKLYERANATLSLTMEALSGIIDAYDPRIHLARGQKGQIRAAADLCRILEGSKNITRQSEVRVQDAYTLRCAPQVHGAILDAIDYVEGVISTEVNAATDNPLLFADTGEAISGGNFHGECLALALDFLSMAVAELANIAERRIERLVNPQLNNGLPAFLAPDGGLNSGFMIPQYVAAALVSENKVLSHPAVVDSITSSANQEDHVSMGMTSARKCTEIVMNTRRVLGIELMTACQAIDCGNRATDLAPQTRALYSKLREVVPFIQADTVMSGHMDEAIKIIEGIYNGKQA